MTERVVHLWCALALSACCGIAGVANAQEAITEDQVKAAYLLRFLSYVQWPTEAFADAHTSLRIGLLGADAVAETLQRIAVDRRVGDHPVEVVRLRPGQSLEGVHVLFVGADEAAWLPLASPRARAGSILLVSESQRGLDEGSDINFVDVGDHVRFEVDLQHAESAHLKLASGLLSVALRVRNSP